MKPPHFERSNDKPAAKVKAKIETERTCVSIKLSFRHVQREPKYIASKTGVITRVLTCPVAHPLKPPGSSGGGATASRMFRDMKKTPPDSRTAAKIHIHESYPFSFSGRTKKRGMSSSVPRTAIKVV